MSDIQALDKLREWFREHPCNDWKPIDAINAIEREILERYMLLPVDADGAPIHVEDVLECHANGYDGAFTVFAIGSNVVVGNHDIEWVGRNSSKWFHVASFCTHVKPDSLKELLSELANEIWETNCTCQTTWSDSGLDGIEKRYAERIRELMGGDGR